MSRKKTRRVICLLIGAAMLVAAFAACGSGGGDTGSGDAPTTSAAPAETAPEPETQPESKQEEKPSFTDDEVSVLAAIEPQYSAQIIVAERLGYFEEEGLNVAVTWAMDVGAMAPAVASGEIDINGLSNYQALQWQDQGLNIITIANVVDASETQIVVGRPGLNLTSATELNGCKMGYINGSGVMVAVYNMCQAMGVDYNGINFVALDPSEMVISAARGDIDCYACWEPWGVKGLAEGCSMLFTGTTSYLPENNGETVDWLGFYIGIGTSAKYLEEHRAECLAYVRAMYRANEYLNANLEECAGWVAEQLDLAYEDCLQIMQLNKYTMELDTTYYNNCEVLKNYMLEADLITSDNLTIGDFIISDLLEEVKQGF